MNEQISYRDAWAQINLDHIEDNVVSVKNHLHADTMVMAVVKANAYGHGAVQVAKTAIAAGAEWLGVALLEEALVLREAGIDLPILILGWSRPKDVDIAAKNSISLTVFQVDWVVEARRHYSGKYPLQLHLKMDSGMGRIGMKGESETKRLIDELRDTSHFHIEGVYTHFATADELDNQYFNEQYERFLQMVSWLEQWDVRPPVIHCGNSATALRFPDKVFNLIRFGISLYGLSPSEEIKPVLPFPLKEAFSLQSILTHVKQLEPGESVSYGATYVAKEKQWIGTIPLGYADGWLRQIAKKGEVLVDGKRCPIVGRICMDQFMVRLPYQLNVGTKVTLIGKQGKEQISVDDLAKQIDTISYEIPCMISYRVPRISYSKKALNHFF